MASTAQPPALPDLGQQPQRQDSLDDQLADVIAAANRLGCYDAADWIRQTLDARQRGPQHA